jgi:hypothetical protein
MAKSAQILAVKSFYILLFVLRRKQKLYFYYQCQLFNGETNLHSLAIVDSMIYIQLSGPTMN